MHTTFAADAAQFRGSAGVLAVVLLELALGSIAVLWVTPVWGVVKRGFFLLIGWTVLSCALLARLAAGGALQRTGQDAAAASGAMWAFVVLAAGFVVTLHLKRMPAARSLGMLAVVPGLIAIVALAGLRGGSGAATAGGIAAMLAGAAFLGTTWNGMVLGHWYLVDRKLSVKPMRAYAIAYSVSVGLALVSAALAKGGAPTPAESALNPLLLVSSLTVWLAFGLVGVCALLAFFVHKLVAEGSIRAATGMLYLAVIMAMSAEFAAKARFFTL